MTRLTNRLTNKFATIKLLFKRPTASLEDFTLDSFNNASHLLNED